MREIIKKENVFGGKGEAYFDYLLNDEQLNNMCKLFSRITLPPGSALGYHEHRDESETYYILSGTGKYTDTQKNVTKVVPGDVTFTPDGESHAIENDGTEDLVFMALVIFNEKRNQ